MTSTISAAAGATSDLDTLYETAVEALMSPLHQSTTKEEIIKSSERRVRTIEDMNYYWDCCVLQEGPPPSTTTTTRTTPRMIHITGTKGKGSTACFCESVLRRNGYRTGLFTSPHLIDIRERIRLDGLPVHKHVFATTYWKLRRAIEERRRRHDDDDDDDASSTASDLPPKYPGYFRMLTLMAYHIFLYSTEVDVMIVEVGMGGRYDATNFWTASSGSGSGSNTGRVCGVTLLDYDHVRVLGNTLEKIAWEKGGIFKVNKLDTANISKRPQSDDDEEQDAAAAAADGDGAGKNEDNTVATTSTTKTIHNQFFILDSNTDGVIRMIESCAKIEGQDGILTKVDSSGQHLQQTLQDKPLGLAGIHQYGNATLALKLCQTIYPSTIKTESAETIQGLTTASWPARCQTYLPTTDDYNQKFAFYLDGAHTPQSMEATVEWFTNTVMKKTTTSMAKPILVFNCSHERNPIELLELLKKIDFAAVYFCRSDSSRPSPVAKASAETLLSGYGMEIKKELLIATNASDEDGEESQQSSTQRTWQETLGCIWNHLTYDDSSDDGDDTTTATPNIQCNVSASDVLMDIAQQRQRQQQEESASTTTNNEGNSSRIPVFVTGSLYLVGSFLTALGWEEESSPLPIDLS
jgi:folylpolyglutamate synthase